VSERLKRKLLAVLAHPDDESFGPGGTLAYYGKNDVDVHLICATRGEAGEIPPDFNRHFDDIGQLREHELRCAASHLRLSELIFLGYRDSGMAGAETNQHPQALVQAPMENLVAEITHHIRRIRPQVVITFDPYGGYGHPDHIAMHQATLGAFEVCSDPSYPDDLEPFMPQKLYYHTFPRRQLNRHYSEGRHTNQDLSTGRLLGHASSVILPATGTDVSEGRPACWVVDESEVIPLHAPISGRVEGANQEVQASPSLLGTSPYDDGWLLDIHCDDDPAEAEGLLSARQMQDRTESELRTLHEEGLRDMLEDAVVGPTLADGGEPIGDLRRMLGPERFHELIKRFLL